MTEKLVCVPPVEAHRAIADRIVNDWKVDTDSSRGLNPLREAIATALEVTVTEAIQRRDEDLIRRWQDEANQLMNTLPNGASIRQRELDGARNRARARALVDAVNDLRFLRKDTGDGIE